MSTIVLSIAICRHTTKTASPSLASCRWPTGIAHAAKQAFLPRSEPDWALLGDASTPDAQPLRLSDEPNRSVLVVKRRVRQNACYQPRRDQIAGSRPPPRGTSSSSRIVDHLLAHERRLEPQILCVDMTDGNDGKMSLEYPPGSHQSRGPTCLRGLISIDCFGRCGGPICRTATFISKLPSCAIYDLSLT